MSRAGKRLLSSAGQALAYARGEADERQYRVRLFEHVDVKATRKKLGMTQAEFAQSFGFSVGTIRNWERGSRQPEGPARAYLTVIDRDPDAVRRALLSAA